tara:strand:+ start:751 stop:1518 length:768 start_codon:yes stop_codon:yes gene_type:complete
MFDHLNIRALFPDPVALLSTENGNIRHLVISDLHIGFEEQFVASGVKVGVSTQKMLEMLLRLINKWKPDSIIMLGDVKHSIDRISRPEWDEVPRFLEQLLRQTKVKIIPGNHDGGITPLLPREVELAPNEGISIASNVLLHGHMNLLPQFSDCQRIIMGHLHPVYNRRGSPLTGTQVWVSLKVDRASLFEGESGLIEILVLPSFNMELSNAGWSSNRKKIISPILRRGIRQLNDAVITTLSGEVIGDVDSMQHVL